MLVSGEAVTIFRSNGVAHLLSLYRYSFRSQYLYSSSSTHLSEKYLVDSLGFSNEEAANTFRKITSRKTFKDPGLVLKFLIKAGFDKTQIKQMVSRTPKLLFCDVSTTLKPKLQFLRDLGFSGSGLVDVFARGTKLIERGLDTHLRPTINLLRRILGGDENVVKAIKRAPWLLSTGVLHTMETNILLLRNYGFSDVDIRRHVLRNPRHIAQNPEWVKDLFHRVEKDFRVPCDSPMFLSGFHVIASHKKSTLERKIGIFKRFGWSDDDVLKMFGKLPFSIGHSEIRIQKALNFYMNELGLEPAYMVSHPAMWTYSLEKRVIPRLQVLKILDEKKLERRNLSFYTVLLFTESKFIEHFVLPYKDQIPDLYESHKKSVAP
ncbi:hypothetical protein HAX54_014665 [Datura stramonium]|uniref:Uncharacterized protein n=1 Tax=Datura stramonium TaxID=4076 RepID=A0ABS8TRH3_DATST|nr:hypothetical protein [Datura stramonium]